LITKIEIDGFKSFAMFSLTLPPFAVILGPNAAGKSNLFDALRLLSRLAVSDVRTAMRELRGEPLEMFRRSPDEGIVRRMTFAVETLLEPTVRDDFGQEIELAHTRLRYELAIVRREEDGIERFFVEYEQAIPIHKKDDTWWPYGTQVSEPFADHFIARSGRRTKFLETVEENKQRYFELRQDGTPGRQRKLPAREAYRSVLSGISIVQEFPHLYALKMELANLRYLQLDASSERSPSPIDAPEVMEADGSNLAAVLFRIRAETATTENANGALTDIRNDLVAMVPGIVNLTVTRDEEKREYRVELKMRDGQVFNSRVLSDGTLRILALLTLLHDPRHRGVLCFEEPENGVHQTRLGALMAFLENSCTDPSSETVSESQPFRQIIINTHSPIAARVVKRSVILATMSTLVEPGSRFGASSRTVMRPYRISESRQEEFLDPKGASATRRQIEQLLEASESADWAA
jgi:predicted ATPase